MTMTRVRVSVTVAGVNTIVTIFTCGQGQTLGRLPIFTWARWSARSQHLRHATSLAFTAMITTGSPARRFLAAQGGTGCLWENAFWIFGHPEV